MSVAFINRLVPAVALGALLWPTFGLSASPTAPVVNFPTEREAEQHCAGDLVVWLDLPSKVYHYRGQRSYGATASGAYVCRDEAKRAGMRATRSVQ
jgi:hypothetical protein